MEGGGGSREGDEGGGTHLTFGVIKLPQFSVRINAKICLGLSSLTAVTAVCTWRIVRIEISSIKTNLNIAVNELLSFP